MKFFRRTKYLFYYLWTLNKHLFGKFFRFVKAENQTTSFKILVDILQSVYRYNIGIMDYFYFRFYEKNSDQRQQWVGTGYKYEYDLLMNPLKHRSILSDKILFYQTYQRYVRHNYCTYNDLKSNSPQAQKVFENPTGKIIVKDSKGQCGWGVELIQSKDFTLKTLAAYMKKRGFNLAEEYIVQHPALMKLSDSGLNTVRIITQLNSTNQVDILGAYLRITINSHVDNMASGNMAAPINLKTGKVCGPAVFSDISRKAETYHPITGVPILEFTIPFWQESVDLAIQAALFNTLNRSIGWDIAITANGPGLLEGNHNWCKILWQLPVNKGMKYVLEKYKTDLLQSKATSHGKTSIVY